MANESRKFEILGAKEVVDALGALKVDIQAKLLKGFLRKIGKKFIVDELKATLPYSQKTKDTIKVFSGSKGELQITAGVGRKGYKLRWTELGTKLRKTKKGRSTGQITGKNQIQPTIERQIDPIVKYFNEEMATEINKSLERRLKSVNKKLGI